MVTWEKDCAPTHRPPTVWDWIAGGLLVFGAGALFGAVVAAWLEKS